MSSGNITVHEERALAEFESIIDRGSMAFMEAGAALMAIRDQRLYRREYKNFEAYCKARWNLSRPRAYQLMAGAGTAANLSTIVDKPTAETQVRHLAKLPPSEQPAAWKDAVAAASTEGRKVTEKDVKAEVTKRTARKEKPAERPNERPPCDGMQFAQMAIMDLEKISREDTEREQAFETVTRWINANS
jgi:hypothetical protein